MSELQKDSVERTLCIPLWSRAFAEKKLPSILPDRDAARILKEMGETKPPTLLYHFQCAALAGAIRQHDFACEIREYLAEHPAATIVEMGAGLSCLRRQMQNETNPWINIDFPDVIACREKYIPKGEKEENIVCDLTDHKWFDSIPYGEDTGVIFLAAGVLHYFTAADAAALITAMAERFKGGRFIFDFISEKGKAAGNFQVGSMGNATRMTFTMENAELELPPLSKNIKKVTQKGYFEGYPVKGVSYSPLTKAYIRSKRDKYLVARLEF